MSFEIWHFSYKLFFSCLVCAMTINVVGLGLSFLEVFELFIYFLAPKCTGGMEVAPSKSLAYKFNSLYVSVKLLYCYFSVIKFWNLWHTCESQIKLPLKLKQEYLQWSMRKKDCSMIYWHLKVIATYKFSFSIEWFLHIHSVSLSSKRTLFTHRFLEWLESVKLVGY